MYHDTSLKICICLHYRITIHCTAYTLNTYIYISTALSFEIQLLLFCRVTSAGGWEMHSEIFLELVERLLGCIDSLEPRGLSMTAYSAAKLLFGDYRRAETYVRDPKKQGVVSVKVGFLVSK